MPIQYKLIPSIIININNKLINKVYDPVCSWIAKYGCYGAYKPHQYDSFLKLVPLSSLSNPSEQSQNDK
jgi:hypothetical protein